MHARDFRGLQYGAMAKSRKRRAQEEGEVQPAASGATPAAAAKSDKGAGKGAAGKGGAARAALPWVCVAGGVGGCTRKGVPPFSNLGWRTVCFNCGAAKPAAGGQGGKPVVPPCPTVRTGGAAAGGAKGGGKGGGGAPGGKGGGKASAPAASGGSEVAQLKAQLEKVTKELAAERASGHGFGVGPLPPDGAAAAAEPAGDAGMDGVVDNDALQAERRKEIAVEVKKLSAEAAHSLAATQAVEKSSGIAGEELRKTEPWTAIYANRDRLIAQREVLLAERRDMQPAHVQRKRLTTALEGYQKAIEKGQAGRKLADEADAEAKRVFEAALAENAGRRNKAAEAILQHEALVKETQDKLTALGPEADEAEGVAADLVVIDPLEQKVIDRLRKDGHGELADEMLARLRGAEAPGVAAHAAASVVPAAAAVNVVPAAAVPPLEGAPPPGTATPVETAAEPADVGMGEQDAGQNADLVLPPAGAPAAAAVQTPGVVVTAAAKAKAARAALVPRKPISVISAVRAASERGRQKSTEDSPVDKRHRVTRSRSGSRGGGKTGETAAGSSQA